MARGQHEAPRFVRRNALDSITKVSQQTAPSKAPQQQLKNAKTLVSVTLQDQKQVEARVHLGLGDSVMSNKA